MHSSIEYKEILWIFKAKSQLILQSRFAMKQILQPLLQKDKFTISEIKNWMVQALLMIFGGMHRKKQRKFSTLWIEN